MQIPRVRQDAWSKLFAHNHEYLRNQATKAIGAMYSRKRDVGTFPPYIMLHMYDSSIISITIYGSEVWGRHHPAQTESAKVFYRFAIRVLRVKPTTSNIILLVECSALLPSAQCIISLLCDILHNLPNICLVKEHTVKCHGWKTTISLCQLARPCCSDVSYTTKDFQKNCKKVLRTNFIRNCFNNFNNIVQNPLLSKKIQINFQPARTPSLPDKRTQASRCLFAPMRQLTFVRNRARGLGRPQTHPLKHGVFCYSGWAALCSSVYH